ncbi:MAG: hypothetical protein ACPHEP_05940 [Acidimicrobiales bacterium]
MAHEDDLNEEDPQVDPVENNGSDSPEDQGSEQNPIPPLPTAGESDANVPSGSGSSEVSSDDYGTEDNPSDESVADANELGDSGFGDSQAESPVFPNTLAPESAIRPVQSVDKDDSIPEQVKVPPFPTAGEKPTREDDASNLGPMSFYKRKNIDKGRGDNIPGLEKGEDGKYRQTGNLDSGQERDEEGLNQQKQIDLDSLQMPSGPLGVDLMPDIIPDLGVDGPSSFKPQGQDSNNIQDEVQSAADSIDTATVGILNVLARLTMNMKKANDQIRQLMDKLEVEDHRDEF